MIHYKRHKDIDFAKWDKCIDLSCNGMPYAYSWYLNIATEYNWEALILDDYDAVFPLPFKNRLVYKEIYHPFYIQQLGLFTTQELQSQLHYFINSIPTHFRKIYLQLNTQNPVEESFLKVKQKITHHIDLRIPYETIYNAYNLNTKRNLKKALKNKLLIEQNIMPAQLISFRKKYLANEFRGIQKDTDHDRLQKIMEKILSINKGYIKGVIDDAGEIIAMAFFIRSNGLIIYLSGVSSDIGMEKNGMTYLIDQELKINAEKELIFDFEGSMIPGLAKFYKGFGGKEIQYPAIYK